MILLPCPTIGVFYLFLLSQLIINDADGTEYCLRSVFRASCKPGEFIVMERALYGRMRMGECNKSARGLGCSKDVLSVADKWCTGRESCIQRITNDLFTPVSHPDQCQTTTGNYADMIYTCHKEPEIDVRQCLLLLDTPEVVSGSFLLTSALRHNCALANTPLRIEAKSGQQINITMIDATLPVHGSRDDSACPVPIGRITDKANPKPVPLCGSKNRWTNVFLSNGNKLELVVHRGLSETNFIFHYQVIGCADPDRIEGGSTSRVGSSVMVTCDDTGRKWELKCVNNEWMGTTQAVCDKAGSPSLQHYKEDGKSGVSVPRDMVVIVTGVVTLCASAVIVSVGFVQLYKTLGCRQYIERKRAGYSLPPEFPSDGEYYDGQELPMRAMQPMSSSFVQITNPRGPSSHSVEPPSPTAMTLNSQYENMSTGSSKGAVYEPLELQRVPVNKAGSSTQGARHDIMNRSVNSEKPNTKKKSSQTPIRQKYKGFAQTLRMRQNKKNKKAEEFRKSAPIQPPRISSLIKEGSSQPATPKHSNTAKSSRSRRNSKSAPSRRVPTPPPSPPPELKMALSSATDKSSPTYSVPMRNSMLQSEIPDVVYQTTEVCFGSGNDEEESYEVPVSQRGGLSSTSGTTRSSGSGGGSIYAPVRMKDALSTFQAPPTVDDDADELESVYSCTQAVDAVTNSPINSSKNKPVISMTRKLTDPDAKMFTELDLSKPIVIPTILDINIDADKGSNDQQTTQKNGNGLGDGVYANIGPRSKRASALLNTSDYGALCEHSSNARQQQQDISENEDVYSSAQQYYVNNSAPK